MKIKSNKICLVGIILILYFSFLFQGNNISLNEEDDKNSKNFVLYSSASNSVFVEWNITFGGSMDDFGMGLALDSSGNAYITGFTNLGGGPPMFGMNLVKYNNSGVQKWNSTWGGWDEEGNAIAVDSADNVFVTGKMENYTGMTNDDMFLMKYDSSGIQQWNRSWGGTWNDEGFGVVVDSAGNVYVTGVLDNDIASENDIFLSCDKPSKKTNTINTLNTLNTLNTSIKNYHPGVISQHYENYLKKDRTKKRIYAFTCGPTVMMKAIDKITSHYKIPLKVLMEKRMACGIGVCLSCVCHTRTKNNKKTYARVCTDGPLFDAGEIDWSHEKV